MGHVGKFKKGDAKPPNSGRKKGTPNKRTLVQEMLEQVAAQLGGTEGMFKWARRNKEAFYTQMLMRLLPAHLQEAGRYNPELILKYAKEDFDRRLEERGLPPIVFGADKPMLELQAEPKQEENGDARKPERAPVDK